ncbi:type IV conjugative transfer system protein TraL [Providencia rettgeri]|uniref:type IV conjugative transfer system protein TraL n=1 Tax=Providencia rettgeri TaxID=587 RepID=UPI0018E484A4|nr:type IV conjugative transfer system protein TraL [Providencia rettgeri]MBI6194781.1 type IV conjugative transfer system protein TraL [Providencia rettgeri]
MEEERAKRFIFPQTLTEQSRPIGLPLDETCAIALPLCWGVMDKQYIAGVVVGALLWFALRYFKKGRGTDWLINACYWYLPSFCIQGMYKRLPDSAFRLWLK